MSTIELRNKLHSLIDSINDNEKLKAVLTLLNNKESNDDWYNDLSSNQKQSIEKGLDDIKNGRLKSNVEAKAHIDNFISKNYA